MGPTFGQTFAVVEWKQFILSNNFTVEKNYFIINTQNQTN